MSLRLHPKCPECGKITGKKYKLIILTRGDYDCHFCKARLAPRFKQHWPLRLGLAAIASISAMHLVPSSLFGIVLSEHATSLVTFIAAFFTIRSVDCFVEPKSFGRL